MKEGEELVEEGFGLLLGNVVPAVGQDDAVQSFGNGGEEGAETFTLPAGSRDAEGRHGEWMLPAPGVLRDVGRNRSP